MMYTKYEEECFKKVEKTLSEFPNEYSKNYYDNKEYLVINREEHVIKSINGSYDEEHNIITLYEEDALVHELFHASFRDKNKLSTPVIDDVFYSNGIAVARYIDSKKCISGKAITEGFVRYLTKKTIDVKDNSIEYFITNILINIYGEDILKYPFLNDCLGFACDKRFTNMDEIVHQLDRFLECRNTIALINNSTETMNNILNSDNLELKKEIFNIISKTKIAFKKSIISLFNLVIDECNNYSESKISIDYINNQINEFLSNDQYKLYLLLDDNKISVRNELEKLTKSKTKKFRK